MSVRDFDLDLARAITEQLVETFEQMPASSLTAEALAESRDVPGVYQLYVKELIVYVGKSDSSLRNRLARHMWALTGRMNISIGEVTFKAIHLSRNWSALTTEAALITHFGRTPWNNSGFGSNDPGRNRDNTAVPADSFDGMFPIDPDVGVQVAPGEKTVEELLGQLKEHLPYLLRYGTSAAEREELRATKVVVPQGQTTARGLLLLAARALPNGWQATILPGRMLFYRERATYTAGQVIWPLPH